MFKILKRKKAETGPSEKNSHVIRDAVNSFIKAKWGPSALVLSVLFLFNLIIWLLSIVSRPEIGRTFRIFLLLPSGLLTVFWFYLMVKVWNAKLALVTALSFLITFIIFAFSSEMYKNVVIINDITIPSEITSQYQGLTGHVLSDHLRDGIFRVYQNNKKSRPRFFKNIIGDLEYQEPILDKAVSINYQGIGLSLNSFLLYLKRSWYLQKIFNYKYYTVDGEVLKLPYENSMRLYLRISGDNYNSTNGLLPYLSEIYGYSTFLLENIDPVALALYYNSISNYQKTVALCDQELYKYRGDKSTTKSLYFQLGFANSRLNNNNLALTNYLKLYQIDKGSGINFILGKLYYQLGDQSNAYYYLNNVRIPVGKVLQPEMSNMLRISDLSNQIKRKANLKSKDKKPR